MTWQDDVRKGDGTTYSRYLSFFYDSETGQRPTPEQEQRVLRIAWHTEHCSFPRGTYKDPDGKLVCGASTLNDGGHVVQQPNWPDGRGRPTLCREHVNLVLRDGRPKQPRGKTAGERKPAGNRRDMPSAAERAADLRAVAEVLDAGGRPMPKRPNYGEIR